jgi:hypothetical protein
MSILLGLGFVTPSQGGGWNVEEGYIDCLGLGFVASVNSSIIDEGALVTK